ncbi:MAG: PaaI family thioesterase [Bacteroidales bacterium]|nr:PaaI family thioesterase [Bacteroidales bacterium]
MTVKEINQFCRNSFIDFLNIDFLDFGENFIEAKMPVKKNKLQPMGVLHGGVSLALAETVASAGSFLLIDNERYDVLGLQVTGNHVATVNSGEIIGRAEIVHKGSSTHIWDVKISTPDNKLISVARVTNIIIEKKEEG